jgi:hypothetical protein
MMGCWERRQVRHHRDSGGVTADWARNVLHEPLRLCCGADMPLPVICLQALTEGGMKVHGC